MKDKIKSAEDFPEDESEVDVFQIFLTIYRNRGMVLISMAIFLLLSVIYLHLSPYKYTAEMKIIPVQSSASGINKKLGGLASLAGVDLQSDSKVAPFDLYKEEINSRVVAEELSHQTNLMKAIFPHEWDEKHGDWRQPQSIMHSISYFMKTILGVPLSSWQPPNGAQVQKYIIKEVHIDEKPKKATIGISIDNKNPKTAIAFLTALHQITDENIRKRDLDRTTQYIDYLNAKIATVSVAEYRAALITLLSEQEKTRMIASSKEPYAAEMLDPPYASERPTSPQPVMVLITFLFLGLISGIAIVFGKLYLKDRKIID